MIKTSLFKVIFLIFLTQLSCFGQESIVLNFRIKNIENIDKINVYQNENLLYSVNPKTNIFSLIIIIDTIAIPKYFVGIEGKNNFYTQFFIDTNTIDIGINDNSKEFVFNNSLLTKKYLEYRKQLNPIVEKRQAVYVSLREEKSNLIATKLELEMDILLDSMFILHQLFAEENTNSMLALDFIYLRIVQKDSAIYYLSNFYKSLNNQVRNSFWGQECNRLIQLKLSQNRINRDSVLLHTNIRDKLGVYVTIADAMDNDKKNIIVFTSNYCPPCIPNINEMLKSIKKNKLENDYQLITINMDAEFDVWKSKKTKYNSTNNYFLEKGSHNNSAILLDIKSSPYNFLIQNSKIIKEHFSYKEF